MLTDEEKKEKQKQYFKSWQAKNREKRKEKRKAYRAKNRDKLKGAEKKWRDENKDKEVAASARYSKKYPEKRAALRAKRRASERNRTPNWLTKEQLSDIQKLYGESSRLSKLTGVKFNVDHIVPLQGKHVSGLHVPWNLQVLPYYDNIAKGNKC